jgi:hypothetical protein
MKENSEFRDFYDFGQRTDSEDGKDTDIANVDGFVNVDKTARRLASGKVISHRIAQKQREHQHIAQIDKANTSKLLFTRGVPKNSGLSSGLEVAGGGKASTSAETRAMLFNKQLAIMRAGDRQALMHLPISQQRAVTLAAKLQQEKWNRAQLAHEIKRQIRANT